MKRLLELLRTAVVESTCMTGMCGEVDTLCYTNEIINIPEIIKLREYLMANAPDICIEYYKEEMRLLDEEKYDSERASHQAAETVGHPYKGYWFQMGDKEPRLEWLDKHIASC